MKAKVSVVIPNYNGEKYIMQCMEAIMNQDVRSFEVIFVDDASTDNSLNMVMEKFPSNGAFPLTKYIKHDKNSGFCVSVNDGIKESSSDYVILLNNDTVVKGDFVRQMYNSILRKDNIFSVSAKMLTMQDENIVDDNGDFYNALGWAFTKGKGKASENCNKRRKIFAACGGAAIYRRSALEEIGLFDENHFAYLEDIDIGYRAKLHGYINIYEPNAEVLHLGSATSGSRYNEFKANLSARNNVYLVYKNMALWQKIINFPFLIIGFGIKTVFYISKGMGKTYIKGLYDGLKMIRKAEAKEHKVQFKKVKFGTQLKLQGELWLNILRRFI